MAKKEKMPKFSGFRMTKDGLGPPVYEVTMTVAPDDYGVSHSATNREMVHGVLNHVNGEMLALRARAEAAEAEVERLRAVITKAVDDLPEWSDGALKHLSPAEVMADEVRMALRRALGGV